MMTWRSIGRPSSLAVPLLLAHPAAAWAHAFGERYDLPVPLGYFVVGAAATVALSFVVAALFMRRARPGGVGAGILVPLGPVLPALRAACVGGVGKGSDILVSDGRKIRYFGIGFGTARGSPCIARSVTYYRFRCPAMWSWQVAVGRRQPS